MTAHDILDTVPERPLTVLVFFRGQWCPFCQSYLRELDKELRTRVEGAGGRLFGVTSQSATAAAEAHQAWGLHYDVVSQPNNELAQRFGVFVTPKAETILADHPTEYPEGMAQPAVIALDRDGEVLYRWAIVPSEMNIGGATDRPLPAEIWASIEAARAGRTAPSPSADRLDVDFVAKHYPEQHQTFLAWIGGSSEG